jgi:hypothetical protein
VMPVSFTIEIKESAEHGTQYRVYAFDEGSNRRLVEKEQIERCALFWDYRPESDVHISDEDFGAWFEATRNRPVSLVQRCGALKVRT